MGRRTGAAKDLAQVLTCALLSWLPLLVGANADAPERPPPIEQRWWRVERVVFSAWPVKGNGPASDCEELVRTPSRVRFFLRHALGMSAAAYAQNLQFGDCSIEARVRLKNGGWVKVIIDHQTGWGGVVDGAVSHFLYCEACEGLFSARFGFDPRTRSALDEPAAKGGPPQ